MDVVSQSDFINCYTRVLSSILHSSSARSQLLRNPRATLAQMGLQIPMEAEVDITECSTPEPDLRRQLSLWVEGFTSGRFIFMVPNNKSDEYSEICDSDLGDLAGGLGPDRPTPVL